MSPTESIEPPQRSPEINPFHLAEIERAQFKENLIERGYPEEEVERKIMLSYFYAEGIHSHQLRDSGEPFFKHPVATALIVVNELSIIDPNVITHLLLHDTYEDTGAFGELKKDMLYSELAQKAYAIFEHLFGKKVALMTLTASRPKVDHQEVADKEQAEKLFREQLTSGMPFGLSLNRYDRRLARRQKPKVHLGRLADRLHFFRDIYGLDDERVVRKISETDGFLFKIIPDAETAYPTEVDYLKNEIRKEIAKFKAEKPQYFEEIT